MLVVTKDGHWYSSWPQHEATLRHIKDFYILMGYTCEMVKEVLHITKR